MHDRPLRDHHDQLLHEVRLHQPVSWHPVVACDIQQWQPQEVALQVDRVDHPSVMGLRPGVAVLPPGLVVELSQPRAWRCGGGCPKVHRVPDSVVVCVQVHPVDRDVEDICRVREIVQTEGHVARLPVE